MAYMKHTLNSQKAIDFNPPGQEAAGAPASQICQANMATSIPDERQQAINGLYLYR